MHVLHVCQFRVIFYYMHFKDTLYHRVFPYLSASHINISSEEVTLAKTSVPLNFYWVPLLISSTPRVLIPTPSYPYSMFPSKFTARIRRNTNLWTRNAFASHNHSIQQSAPAPAQQYFSLTPLQPPAPAPTSTTVFFSHTIPAPEVWFLLPPRNPWPQATWSRVSRLHSPFCSIFSSGKDVFLSPVPFLHTQLAS